MKKDYKFKPALLFDFLTPFYDLFGKYGLRDKLQKRVLKSVEFKRNWKLLDVGCGTGEDLMMLKSKYPEMRLYGIDADPRIIEIAKKKNSEKKFGINFQLAFAEELPFKKNLFDAVWCNLVLHHLPTNSKKQAIKEMYRVLKKGGKYFLIEFSRPQNRILAKIVLIQNFFSYTKDNYEDKIPRFIKAAGFKRIREEKFWLHMSIIQAVK